MASIQPSNTSSCGAVPTSDPEPSQNTSFTATTAPVAAHPFPPNDTSVAGSSAIQSAVSGDGQDDRPSAVRRGGPWATHTPESFLAKSKEGLMVGISYNHRQERGCPYSAFYAKSQASEMEKHSELLSKTFGELRSTNISRVDQVKNFRHATAVVNDANATTGATSSAQPRFVLMGKDDYGQMVHDGTVEVCEGSAPPPAWSAASSGVSKEEFYQTRKDKTRAEKDRKARERRTEREFMEFQLGISHILPRRDEHWSDQGEA